MGKQTGTFTHYRTCNLCEAMCGLEIEVVDDQVKTIKGDKNDPFSQGYICPKATGLQDIYQDPDRLTKPVKKTDNGWEEISWKEAFDLVEEKINALQEQHGPNALGVYQGNPNVHSLGAMLFSPNLIRSLKTRNRFSATSVDQLPHHYASQFMIGHMSMIPVPDINRTEFFLCMGANPVVSNGSLMSAGGMPQKMKALRARGGKIVVVDPRRTETADKSDQHLFIKPGADVYLLASMIHLLFEENKVQQLPDHYERGEGLKEMFQPYAPENTAPLAGIEPAVVRQLVTDFCDATSAVCYGRMGLSTQEHGVLCQWMINLINILTGNFDTEGGAMFPSPAFDPIGMSGRGTYKKYNRWQSAVRNLPEFGGELPVAAMAEDILAGGIKGMLTIAGNPVLSTPNGGQLEKALECMEFMVSVDIYINETTKYADVILPPATGLENDHYDVVFHTLAIHNHAKYSEALFEPKSGAMKDWEIFKALTKRFAKQSLGQKLQEPFLTPQAILDGGFKRSNNNLSVKKLKKEPHGVDMGPHKPVLTERIFTDSGKVDLAPALFVEQLKNLKLDHDQDGLVLIGRRLLRSNNSWMHNSLRLVKGPEKCTLLIHPDDAASRSIADQQEVEVSSRVGKVKIKAEISEEVMKGVVSIPHGWGHNRKGTQWKIAEEHAGVSINDLTDDQFIDPISGNAAFSGVKVEVA
jgi:anaerobic selenocysteine-containing dehydrogenase